GAPTFLEQACLRAVRDSVACKLDSERRYSGGLVGSVSGHHVDADYADVGLRGDAAHLRCQLSLHQPHWPFQRFPRVVATRHVTCVKTSLSQRCCTLAPNMKAIDAEGHDGHLFRQRAHPLFYALWVAPYRTLGDVLTPRRVVTRTCVDQLDFVTALDH